MDPDTEVDVSYDENLTLGLVKELAKDTWI